VKILIAEDDPICSLVLQRLLEPYVDCEKVANGKEAVAAFTEAIAAGSPYDLLLLDIMMPEMGGQDVLKEVRKIEEDRGIIYPEGVTIIMTTDLDDSGTLAEAFQSRCNAYFVKPITEKHLMMVIKEFFPNFGGGADLPAGTESPS